MMKKTALFCALIYGFLMLAGCGQTGPLYLPQPKPAANASHTTTTHTAQAKQ